MKNMEIIKKAQDILESGYAFKNHTVLAQISFFSDLSCEDYTKLDYKLKAIRQDFSKILVVMNSIERTYTAYQKNEYIPSYVTLMNNQATSEIGCFIEYLFAKYRVILEYIQQVLEICIPPKFNDNEKADYASLKKAHTKYNFLLRYIAKNVQKETNLLNMEWFQQLRIERDFIIHDGATCLVFGDKKNLLFKIMAIDALDKEQEDEPDTFFANDRNLIYYSRYWGLYISKLIVFFETVFEFILIDSTMLEENSYMLKYMQDKGGFVDANGVKIPDIQSVLLNMLKSINID